MDMIRTVYGLIEQFIGLYNTEIDLVGNAVNWELNMIKSKHKRFARRRVCPHVYLLNGQKLVHKLVHTFIELEILPDTK